MDKYSVVQVLVEGQSLDHLIRIPPFGLWGEIGGHLGNWYKQQKRGGNFWFLSPSYLLFMDYILHMSFHIRKQGSTLNMPIAAIENTKLFLWHGVRHCFRPKCFIYKTFFSKSQMETSGLEPETSCLQSKCSTIELCPLASQAGFEPAANSLEENCSYSTELLRQGTSLFVHR